MKKIGMTVTILLSCLLLALSAAAQSFFIEDDGLVVNKDAQLGVSGTSKVITDVDPLATLRALQERNRARTQYDGELSIQSSQEAQDELIENYLLTKRATRVSDTMRNTPYNQHTPYNQFSEYTASSFPNPYNQYDRYIYSRNDHQPYLNGFSNFFSTWPGYSWLGTDFYAVNRIYNYGYNAYERYPWGDAHDRNGYGQYDDDYNYYDDYYRPYDWYYLRDGEFTECNGDEFKQFDCSYRWDGAHYYYAINYPDYLYYNELYNLDDVSVTDRFTLNSGRYSLCPRNQFDHDECVFYWKGDGFFYDNPSDNSFDRDNLELNTDLDDDVTASFSASIRNAEYYNQYPRYNFVNGGFVSCSSGCQYYEKEGRFFGSKTS